MKACVDKSKCIGCGLCAALAPEVFSMEDDGLAKAIEGDIDDSLVNDTEDARNQCPVEAIETE